MFATPIAYLIDEPGVIAADVAVGIDAIRELMSRAGNLAPSEPRLEPSQKLNSESALEGGGGRDTKQTK